MKCSDIRLSRAQETKALAQLVSLLTHLDQTLPPSTPRSARQMLGSEKRLQDLQERGRETLLEEFGFCLEVCASRLEGVGRGVAVSQGRVPSGHLVGLYPGKLLWLRYQLAYGLWWVAWHITREISLFMYQHTQHQKYIVKIIFRVKFQVNRGSVCAVHRCKQPNMPHYGVCVS